MNSLIAKLKFFIGYINKKKISDLKSSLLLENYFKRIYDKHLSLKRKIQNKKNLKVVFGPFYSEVGFEVLYWLPYIQSLKKNTINNCQIISRGGLAKFFLDDIEDFCLIKLIGREKYLKFIKKISDSFEKGINQKSKNMDESSIINENFKIDKQTLIVKPYSMFKYYKPYFSGKIGQKISKELSNYDIYSQKLKKLPELKDRKYDLCLKIYNCRQFYLSDKIKDELIEKIINLNFKKICILETNSFDEHEQFIFDTKSKNIEIIKIPDEDNLFFQCKIISNSKNFISSYGGISYLGPILGANTTCLVDDEKKWKLMSHPHYQKFLNLMTDIEFKGSYNILNFGEFKKLHLN